MSAAFLQVNLVSRGAPEETVYRTAVRVKDQLEASTERTENQYAGRA